jgi:hypothetical protein
MKTDQPSVGGRMMRFIFESRFSRFDMLGILFVVWLLVEQQDLAAFSTGVVLVVISVFFERRLNPDTKGKTDTGVSE